MSSETDRQRWRQRPAVAVGVLTCALLAGQASASYPIPPSYEFHPRLTLRSLELLSVDGEPTAGVESPERLEDAKRWSMASCPRDNLRKHPSGEARLELSVDADGVVTDVRPVDGRPEEAAELVAKVIDLWRFAPLSIDGASVPFVAAVTVDYRCGLRPTPEETTSPDGVERWADHLRALTDGSTCGIVEHAIHFAAREFAYVPEHIGSFTRLAEEDAGWLGWVGRHWLAYNDGSGTASLLAEMEQSDEPCIRCHALRERHYLEDWTELTLDDDLRADLEQLLGDIDGFVSDVAQSCRYLFVASERRMVWTSYFDRSDWSLLCEVEGHRGVSRAACFSAGETQAPQAPASDSEPCD